MSPLIAIDLGTLNTSAALVVDGEPTLIADERGELFTPTCVAAATHGKSLIGMAARHQAALNPRNTVTGARRLLGLPWGDRRTALLRQRLPYALQPGARNEVRIWLRDRSYTPVEVCDMVLARVKTAAEEYLGEPVSRAVITVPAHFEGARRRGCQALGAAVGLELAGLVDDPIAAALAYGIGHDQGGGRLGDLGAMVSGGQLVAVYDLGGTFECTLLEVEGSAMRVIGCAADPLIGGEAVDELLVDWLCAAVAEEHRVDLRDEPLAVQRLSDALEEAKCSLCVTGAQQAVIDLPMILPVGEGEPLDLHHTLERSQLNELCRDLVERTSVVCREALAVAGVAPSAVDEVLLVGGQSALPEVGQTLTSLFGRPPRRSVDPARAVALGAARWAAGAIDGELGTIRQPRRPPTPEAPAALPAPEAGRRPPTGERRRFERQALVLKVDYPSKDEFLTDYTINISHGGMSLCTEQALEIGEALALQISFPGLLAPLDVGAEVRWTRDRGEGEVEVGVELTDRAERARFRRLVDRVLSSDPEIVARAGARVLVLEEADRIGQLVEQAFAGRLPGGKRACEVVGVTDGHEALRAITSQPFDVVVVDVSMPRLAGEATIRAIRARRLDGPPVVAIGDGALVGRDTALGAGADFFLARPVRLSTLIDTLVRLLEG